MTLCPTCGNPRTDDTIRRCECGEGPPLLLWQPDDQPPECPDAC
jgi:hypothetical protein